MASSASSADCSCADSPNETEDYGQITAVKDDYFSIGTGDVFNLGNCTKPTYCPGKVEFRKYDVVNFTACTNSDGSVWLRIVVCI